MTTFTLRPKQEDAVTFMTAEARTILADPPGEGKTPTTLTWLSREGAQRTIIVVPNFSIIQHWVRQAADWYPELNAIAYVGTPAKRPVLRHEFQTTDGPAALVMTYSMMRQDAKFLLRNNYTHAVWDEAHRLKTRTAQQTKIAYQIANRTERICLLTGTPVLNRASELWSLAHTIDAKVYASWIRWTDLHFYIENRYFGGPRPIRVVGDLLPGHAEQVRDEMSGFLLQRDAEPFGEAPVFIPSPVVLTDAERVKYAHMEEWAWAELDEEVVSANGQLAKITRLRQLASDWTILANSLETSSKVQRVADLAYELHAAGEHCVVFSDFKKPLESVAKVLAGCEVPTMYYHGDITAASREGNLERFKGAPAVMLGTHAALGEGVDGLQHSCRYGIMMARDWTPARNDQAIGRVQRRGQTRQVVIYNVFCEDTFDEDIMRMVARKENVIASVKQLARDKHGKVIQAFEQDAVNLALDIAF